MRIDRLDKSVNSLSDPPDLQYRFHLARGQLLADVKKLTKASSYVITTPTTTNEIRGTCFCLSDDGWVMCLNGKVDVNAATNHSVVAGQIYSPSRNSIEIDADSFQWFDFSRQSPQGWSNFFQHLTERSLAE